MLQKIKLKIPIFTNDKILRQLKCRMCFYQIKELLALLSLCKLRLKMESIHQYFGKLNLLSLERKTTKGFQEPHKGNPSYSYRNCRSSSLSFPTGLFPKLLTFFAYAEALSTFARSVVFCGAKRLRRSWPHQIKSLATVTSLCSNDSFLP